MVLNACPSAGDCTRVCVVGNNFGKTKNVQLAWKWRTDFMVHAPRLFFLLLGIEIGRAVDKSGRILFRPNINSDIVWEQIAPRLVDGSVFGDAVKFYGYTKHDYVLDGDSWVTPHYRVAYSWNENSDARRVAEFVDRGGSVAAVTDRVYNSQTREPVSQWHEHPDAMIPVRNVKSVRVLDADQGDEWMFTESSIGDLAFKPRSVELKSWGLSSDFVAKVYHPSFPGMGDA